MKTRADSLLYTHKKDARTLRGTDVVSAMTPRTEAEGLEPPRACARRISSAVPYQLGLRLQRRNTRSGSPLVTGFRPSFESGRLDLNQRPLRPERSALPS